MTQEHKKKKAEKLPSASAAASEILQRIISLQRLLPKLIHGSAKNLTMSQFQTLSVIVEHGPCSMTRIARNLKISTPAVTHLMDKLVKESLAIRVPGPNRRTVHTTATTKGKKLIKKVEDAMLLRVKKSLQNFPPATRANILSFYQKLSQGEL